MPKGQPIGSREDLVDFMQVTYADQYNFDFSQVTPESAMRELFMLVVLSDYPQTLSEFQQLLTKK